MYKLPPIELVKKCMNLDISCSNCGKMGHLYKICQEPIMSYGIICYNKKTKKFLLIQRRHSIAYVDFIRGKYSFDDIKFLYMLLENMSVDERNNLLTKNFDELWRHLWIGMGTESSYIVPYRNNELKKSRNMFEIFNDGLYINNQSYSLKSIIDDVKHIKNIVEWGFPKGRRNKNESDIVCAVREFKEETNMIINKYDIESSKNHCFRNKFIEEFIGSNGISYKYIYFVYITTDSPEELYINKDNLDQIFEVGDIGWFSYEDAIKKIKCRRKRGILRKINLLEV